MKQTSTYINVSNQSLMTLACLKLMNRMLRFNIRYLGTSDLRNHKSILGPPSPAVTSCEETIREIWELMDDKLLYYL